MEINSVVLELSRVVSLNNPSNGVNIGILGAFEQVKVKVTSDLVGQRRFLFFVDLFGVDAGGPPQFLTRLEGPLIVGLVGRATRATEQVLHRSLLDEDPGWDETTRTITGTVDKADGPVDEPSSGGTETGAGRVTTFKPRADEIIARVTLSSGLGRFSAISRRWSQVVTAPLTEATPIPQ